MNDQLIIRTSPENLSEIRKIIQRLDQPPRRLMIAVRQSGNSQRIEQNNQADINLMVGKHAKVIVGDQNRDNSLRYRI
ncbi:MAG: hypothetical protein OQK92_00240, partial [Sedimenticola sp.]|nr:hypothetical protein [Sedimenticola sp.]